MTDSLDGIDAWLDELACLTHEDKADAYWVFDVLPDDIKAIARAVLTRYAPTPLRPIPCSERLPGPGDCDGEGRCWTLDRGAPEPDPFTWVFQRLENAEAPEEHLLWLPHDALPLPEVAK